MPIEWLKWNDDVEEWGGDRVPDAWKRDGNDILSQRMSLLLFLHSAVCE